MAREMKPHSQHFQRLSDRKRTFLTQTCRQNEVFITRSVWYSLPLFLSWWCIRCLWKLLHRYNWKSVTLMPCNTVSLVSQNEPSALSMVLFIVVLMPPADNVGFSVVSSSLAWNLGQNRKYAWRKGASTGVWKFHYLLIDDVSSLIYYAKKMQIPLCFTFGDAFWIKKKLNWIWKRQAFDFFHYLVKRVFLRSSVLCFSFYHFCVSIKIDMMCMNCSSHQSLSPTRRLLLIIKEPRLKKHWDWPNRIHCNSTMHAAYVTRVHYMSTYACNLRQKWFSSLKNFPGPLYGWTVALLSITLVSIF